MNKIILVLSITIALMYSLPTIPAKAVVSDLNTQTVLTENQSRTVGLIRKCGLTASVSDGQFYISGSTIANNEMKSIGYKDISVEYSSDGIKKRTLMIY